MNTTDPIETLRKRIEELRSRFPAHSIPPALIMELDELEAELENRLKSGDSSRPDSRLSTNQ